MPTDPAVEALARPLDDVLGELVAWVSFALDVPVALSEAALDHIAAHLHADTPEGGALRERLGLTVERYRAGHKMSQAAMDADEVIAWGCVNCDSWTERGKHPDDHCPGATTRTRLVSPWRDA